MLIPGGLDGYRDLMLLPSTLQLGKWENMGVIFILTIFLQFLGLAEYHRRQFLLRDKNAPQRSVLISLYQPPLLKGNTHKCYHTFGKLNM